VGVNEELDVLRERPLSAAILGTAGPLTFRMGGARSARSSDLATVGASFAIRVLGHIFHCTLIIAQHGVPAVAVHLHTG